MPIDERTVHVDQTGHHCLHPRDMPPREIYRGRHASCLPPSGSLLLHFPQQGSQLSHVGAATLPTAEDKVVLDEQ